MTLKEYLKEDDVRDFKVEAIRELAKLGVEYKDDSVWVPIEFLKSERTMNRIKYWVKKLAGRKPEDGIDK